MPVVALPRLYRILLISAVWLAVCGATYLNQRVMLKAAPRIIGVPLSALLWGLQALICLVLTYLLVNTRPFDERFPVALRLWLPLQSLVWIGAICSFFAGTLAAPAFCAILLASATFTVLWNSREGRVAWGVASVFIVLACACPLLPLHCGWLVVIGSAVAFSAASFCRSLA